MYKEMPLSEFWIKIRNEYSCIGNKAVTILLQFSPSNMCEIGFSILTNIKTKKRERLLAIEEEMRVAISNVRLDIKGFGQKIKRKFRTGCLINCYWYTVSFLNAYPIVTFIFIANVKFIHHGCHKLFISSVG